jgi:hypothetical protein
MKVLTVTTMNCLIHIAITARILQMTRRSRRKVENPMRSRRKGSFLK